MAFFLRLHRSIISYLGLYEAVLTVLLLLFIYLTCFYIIDLYNTRENFRSFRFVGQVLGSFVLIVLVSVGLFYIFPYIIGRGVFLISFFLSFVLVIIWRLFFSIFFSLTFRSRNVLLVGIDKPTEILDSIFSENPEYQAVGIIEGDLNNDFNFGFKVLGDPSSLEKIAGEYNIDDIVIIRSMKNLQLDKALVNCRMKGICVYDLPRFYELTMGKLPISYMKEKWFLYSNGFGKLRSKVYKRMKRSIDLLVGFLLFVCFFPLGLLVSLCIKLNSRGPIFYIQERVGEDQKLFRLFKFRTMVVDAEKGEPKWAEENDPRVTKVGKILRKTRLDEWPQLLNVIRGEMSLVGPRPEREYFIRKLEETIPFYSLRFSVKPGLTGWAQVNYPYGSSAEDALEKLQYDLYYIKNMSLLLDFRILLKTARTILFWKGR